MKKRFKYLPNVWATQEKFITVELDQDKSKFNTNYRKDFGLIYGIKVLSKDEEVLDVRFYQPKNTMYCAVWLNYRDISSRGTGIAGGYGYDKRSSAFDEAIYNLGFRNFPRFAGSGSNFYAVKAIMKFLGVKKYKIVEFYA